MSDQNTLPTLLAWLHEKAAGSQLYADSRDISTQDSGVFVAYPGDTADGRHYVEQAIARGAVAVVYEAENFHWKPEWRAPHYAVSGLKSLAGPLADAWYQSPSATMFSVAVTGTNGKTTSSQWVGQTLSRLNMPTGVVGTLGVSLFVDGQSNVPEVTGYTTPDPVQLQRKLKQLQQQGAACLAIEATSIGLDQERLNGLHIDVALFTNLTRDHLDYHVDMAAYEAAKWRLFEWPGLKTAVFNLDDPTGLAWAERLRHGMQVIGYSTEGHSSEGMQVLAASEIKSRPKGTEFMVHSPWGQAKIKTHLIGRFNVSNVLGVLGVLLAKGIAWEEAVSALTHLSAPQGRMQQMGGREAPLVVIDFAHTPDALEKGLQALRQVATERQGRLWCVFGCGGDRDTGKRPQMGTVSELADEVIVTSDNPRNEVPMQIIEQIVEGMTRAVQKIEDRATAILQAVRQADKNDVIFLAGRGHETHQEVMGQKLPFADADHVALALASRPTIRKGAA